MAIDGKSSRLVDFFFTLVAAPTGRDWCRKQDRGSAKKFGSRNGFPLLRGKMTENM